MTKNELEQLNNLRTEIRELDKKIAALYNKEIPETKDSVKASKKDWPFIEGHAVIEGIDESASRRTGQGLERLRVLRKNRKQRAIETEARIEEYIDGINDSRTRLMFQYRYIDGFTYERIGYLMHCDRTTVERTIDRYLKNH